MISSPFLVTLIVAIVTNIAPRLFFPINAREVDPPLSLGLAVNESHEFKSIEQPSKGWFRDREDGNYYYIAIGVNLNERFERRATLRVSKTSREVEVLSSDDVGNDIWIKDAERE